MCGPDGQSIGYFLASSASTGGVAPTTKISQLLHLKESTGFWFFEKISRVILEDGWSYSGYIDSSCTGKAYPDGDQFLCDNSECKKRMSNPEQRYSVRLNVEDRDSNTIVVFFDELCRHIVRKTAAEMQQKSDEVPKEILDLKDKFFLFKVSGHSNLKDSVRDFYIGSLRNDPSVIQEFEQSDGDSSEESESDDDLELIITNMTQVGSNAPGDRSINVDGDTTLTPSSKQD